MVDYTVELLLGGRSLPKLSGKWLVALIVAAVAATGGIIFWALRPASQNEPTAVSTTSPDEAGPGEVTALGRLEPEGEVVKVAAPSALGSARVARLLVKEGVPIKPGQPLAVMDVYNRLLAEGMQAEAQVREAQTRLAQVQAGAKQGDIIAQQAAVQSQQAKVKSQEAALAKLGVELQNAEREFQRYEQLYKEGGLAAADLDTRRLQVETKARELQQAQQELTQMAREVQQAVATLNSVAEVRPTDIQQAQAAVMVAQANLQRAKVELENSIVRSPIEGRVIKVHAREGEQVGTDGIASLGRTNQMYAVAEVYETDITKVRKGQRASITSPALPKPISGTVEQVGLQISKNDVLNTDPAADTDSRVVEVKVRLDDSAALSGLTNLQVKVRIIP